jgi:hypothetical protein
VHARLVPNRIACSLLPILYDHDSQHLTCSVAVRYDEAEQRPRNNAMENPADSNGI